MTLKSKLDLFPTSLFEKVKDLKEKSRLKNFFAIVNRAVEKVYLWKKQVYEVSDTLNRNGISYMNGTLMSVEYQLENCQQYGKGQSAN